MTFWNREIAPLFEDTYFSGSDEDSDEYDNSSIGAEQRERIHDAKRAARKAKRKADREQKALMEAKALMRATANSTNA